MTTALLVIDVQASFLARPYWDATRLGDWPEAQRALIDLAREAGMLMVRIIHTEPGSQGAFDPDNGLTRAMEGFEDPADVTFYKTAHNAFTDTGLDRWLRGRGGVSAMDQRYSHRAVLRDHHQGGLRSGIRSGLRQ